jgi:CubicO group peptidase (beta-lactamase class C family)
MRMNRYFAFVMSLYVAGTATAASSSQTEERILSVQRGILPPVLVRGESPKLPSLAERMAQLKVPGVSIAVVHEGRIEWARGFGVTRVGGPPVTPDTLFQAASISKPVFALAVLHLVEGGKLDLDTNVNAYLKTWKVPDNEFTKDKKVTLRGILSHSAGLTVHGFPGYAANEKLPTTVQILDGTPPANTEAIRVDIVPGTQNRYSGGGYVVAQQLLFDVTGVPLPKLMHDSVLAPLGMTRSTYEQPLPASRLSEVATPYSDDGKPVEGGPHTYPEMAPAGLWTTPSDLARYALGVQAALAGKSKQVISAQTAREMLTPVIENQGIGPQVGGRTSRKFFQHGGANEGYRCQLIAYTDGEGAVVMTNSDNGGGLTFEVMRTIAHVYGWPDFGPAERTLSATKPETLDRYVGAYQLTNGPPLVIRKDGDHLVGQVIGDVPRVLFPSSDTEFFAKDVDVVVRFAGDPSGAASSLALTQFGREQSASRLDEAQTRQLMEAVERIAKRFEEQKPVPGSEAALRKLLSGIASGTPDYDQMSKPFADLTRQQLSGMQGFIRDLGPLQSLTFHGVSAAGGDLYDANFEKGGFRADIRLTGDGRIDSVGIGPR